MMTKLSKDLRDVSNKYFTDPELVATGFGICRALFRNGGHYNLMAELMGEMGEAGSYGEYSFDPEDWEPRAYMCLFLAEYLENRDE